MIAESHDGGATFRTMRWVTKCGSAWKGLSTTFDIDRPDFAMTANHDLAIIWSDSRTGTKMDYITGIKYPELINQTATNNGLKIDFVEKKRAGEFCWVVLSGTGTTPPIVLNNMGFEVNLAQDAVTLVGLTFPSFFFGTVDSSGVVSLPNAPNLSLTGLKLHAAAIGIDQNGVFTWFSDPIRY